MKKSTTTPLKKRTVFIFKSNRSYSFNTTGDPTTTLTTTSTLTDPTNTLTGIAGNK